MRRSAKFIVFIVFLIFAVSLQAKKYTISGVVLNSEEKKVPSAEVILIDSDGNEVAKDATGKRLTGKGKFKFKKISSGNYTLEVFKEDVGTYSEAVTVPDDDVKITVTLSKKKRRELVEEPVERIPDDEYVTTELSFEIKKLTAEIGYLGSQLRDLQAKSEMWTNPLSIYSKEIILDNGTTIFGKVVYQDEEMLKVETLLGYLVLNREQIVRIIDNVMTAEEPEYIPEQIRETYSPPPMPKLAKPRYTSAAPTERLPDVSRSANIVLVGNVSETKDRSNNITFSGEVKNIGGRRSDFVKMNFVFRKNWSGETKTITTFIRGAYHTFDTGITTDSSLLPGATGTFEMVIPADFGTFIGYSYTIDWEEYE
ncbi:MAG: hypothetical protein IIA61_00255 [Candidatus Marinimicrobia bacterium]|nr:hypothetical protein [Candidatus Neomarinimicrobiota bacterium]